MNHRSTHLSLDEKHYQADQVEAGISNLWLKRKAFRGGTEDRQDRKPYSIVIPPPNVTGRLHMGHALNNTLQDILIRYKRMCGYDVCWIPGTDHAGISTQSVVKKQLQAEGVDFRALGREKMIQKIWEWKERYGSKITDQLNRLGCSCDWEREAFTMSPKLSKAVRQAFVNLYDKGLIYRGKYIVNWCPIDQTALSNDETYTKDGGEPGFLWHIKYPRVDEKGYVVIATTRPETILGDTAIAVNPEDPRYQDLIGSEVKVPIVERQIPVIADSYVDQDFGTGCLKVTPAHDPNDFEIGKRHNLTAIDIFEVDATLSKVVPDWLQGLDRYEARDLIVAKLKELGLLVKVEERMTPLVRAERSKAVIEYRLCDQWFVNMTPLAQAALKQSVLQGLSFYPSKWESVYSFWLENSKDWCISRQIWWGHQIPAWYNRIDGSVIVSVDTPVQVLDNPSDWYQDEDVLDTWFSSSLWPFSTFGWPSENSDNERELERFYPTSVLVTAKDIIYLWVARMVMMGVFQVGKIPFEKVLINPVIAGEDGETMSKSKGNGIDPLHVIDGATREELEEIVFEARPLDLDSKLEKIRSNFQAGFTGIGADALRFTLATLPAENQQVTLSLKRFEEIGRPFVDKLWNASRFVLTSLKEVKNEGILHAEDKWILGLLDRTVADVRLKLDSLRYDLAFEQAYHFFKDDFCDWYVEIVKPRLRATNSADSGLGAVFSVLAEVLSSIIRLFHPVVPFITEELWGHLYGELNSKGLLGQDLKGCDLCALAPFPEDAKRYSSKLEEDFNIMRQVIRSIRQAKADANIAPKVKVKCIFGKISKDNQAVLSPLNPLIEHLAGTLPIQNNTTVDASWSVILLDGLELYLDLASHRDIKAELVKNRKAALQIEKRVEGIKVKLGNADFISKAPPAVVAKEQAQLDELVVQLAKLHEVISQME